MNGAQLFALFIIGFMAFSTVAFVLSMNSDVGQGSNAPVPDTTTPTQPATRITYTAEVDANVLEVFSSFKMVAATSEFDIASIDSAIAQVDGITSVKSVFRQNAPQEGAQAVTYYVVDVSFDSKKTGFEKISTAILEKTSGFFETTGFFPNALVVVPKELVLENEDLNLSKNYALKDNVIQSYLNSGTIKGDEILARIEISFSGEQPVSTLSSEIFNYSNEAKQHSVSLSLPLIEVLPKLTFIADANYSDRMDENLLKQELLKISDVNFVELFVEPIYYKMLLTVKKPFNDLLEQDLNKSLPLITGISDTQFFLDENFLNAIIGFSETMQLQQLKSNIAAKLSDLNVSSESFFFTEPVVSCSGNIELTITEAKTAAESIKEFFVSNKFVPMVYQIGLLETGSLTDMETKEAFAVDSNSIEAAIFPVHKKGEEIFAAITFYSQRGKLLDAKAIEVVNPVRLG